jgi:hypothetical protein
LLSLGLIPAALRKKDFQEESHCANEKKTVWFAPKKYSVSSKFSYRAVGKKFGISGPMVFEPVREYRNF